MLEQLLSIPPWPSTPSHRPIEWSFTYRPFSTCTHCFMTRHSKQACKLFQANKHTTAACTICRSFNHHADACNATNKSDTGCMICRDAVNVDMSMFSASDFRRPHVITSCPLFMGKRVVINKDTIHITRRQSRQQSQSQSQQPKSLQSSQPPSQYVTAQLPQNAWFRPSPPSSSPSMAPPHDQLVEIIRATLEAMLPQLTEMIITVMERRNTQPITTTTTTLIATAPAAPPTTIAGAVHVAPATSTTIIPPFASPLPVNKHTQQRDRTNSQPQINHSFSKINTPSSNKSVSNTTPILTVPRTPSTTTAQTTSSTSTTPSSNSQSGNKPGFDYVPDEAHRFKPPTIIAQEVDADGNVERFLVKWPLTQKQTLEQDMEHKQEWMTYDHIFNKHHNALNQWNAKGMRKWKRQQQQQTIPTTNAYDPIEIDEPDDIDPPFEEKHDHETQGKPGSSQDDHHHDTTQPISTHKRTREESPQSSNDPTITTPVPTPTPTSARELYKLTKSNKKRRAAAAAATEAISKQQQEQSIHDE